MIRQEQQIKNFMAPKKLIKILDIGVDNIVIPKLFKMKNNSKYLIWYLNDVVRP